MSDLVFDARRSPAAIVRHRIHAEIRAAIIGRRLPPGTKLTEEIIAESFACARGPVRWALDRLQDERLVSHVAHRGAFVAEPAEEEARHLFAARRIIESGVVRCLCGLAHRGDFAPLSRCVDSENDAKARGDAEEALRLSGEFHLIMAAMTKNPIVESVLHELEPRTILAIQVHQRAGTSGCRPDEHRELLALMRAGRTEEAMAAMDRHLTAIEAGLDFAPRGEVKVDLRAVLEEARSKG